MAKTLRRGGAGAHNTPNDDPGREIDGRSGARENVVGRELSQDVADEEDGDCHVEIVPFHPQIFFDTLNARGPVCQSLCPLMCRTPASLSSEGNRHSLDSRQGVPVQVVEHDQHEECWHQSPIDLDGSAYPLSLLDVASSWIKSTDLSQKLFLLSCKFILVQSPGPLQLSSYIR